MLSLYHHVAKLWRRVPFRHVLLMTVFLSFWGDDGWGQHYPFTNFPMYSHLDAESDVLYVTDQSDRPLPFHTMFGTSTSTQKKIFINELQKICNPKGRDTREALPEERRAAGKELMEKLLPKLKRDRIPAGVEMLRFQYKVFRADGDKLVETAPEVIAEHPLQAAPA